MSLREEETFTFFWRIRNFSMNLDDYIESPTFRVRQFGNSEWSLRIHTKANNGFDACYLHCESMGILDESVKMRYDINFVKVEMPADESGEQFEYDFKKRKSYGCERWIRTEDILKEKKKYLPNDTLTIKCVLKFITVEDWENTDHEIIQTLLETGESKRHLLYCNEFRCETIIPFHTRKFLRQFHKIHLSKKNGITLPLLSPLIEFASFYATISEDDSPFVSIEMKREDDIGEFIFVKCIVSTVGGPEGISFSSEDEGWYICKNPVWKLTPFLELSKLEKTGYFKVTGDYVRLQFEFAFSNDDQIYHVEKQYVKHPLSNGLVPAKKLVPLNFNEDQPIVNLKAGDRSFAVHQTLLKDESEVFRVMLEKDMKEKKTGVVDITDVEPDTLGRLISFLYSGALGDLSTAETMDLYAAGHKYHIQSLMDHCTDILGSSLDVVNVSEILVWADLYNESRLLKCAEDFVVGFIEVEHLLLSEAWKRVMDDHASIAARVMHKMLLK